MEELNNEEVNENEEEVYKVEEILGHRNRRGKIYYRIKWEGYDDTQNTWEPEENLIDCPELLESYKSSIKEKKKERRSSRNSGAATKIQNKESEKNPEEDNTQNVETQEPNVEENIDNYEPQNEEDENKAEDIEENIETETVVNEQTEGNEYDNTINEVEQEEEEPVKLKRRRTRYGRRKASSSSSLKCTMNLKAPNQCFFITKLELDKAPKYFEESISHIISNAESQKSKDLQVVINISENSDDASFQEGIGEQNSKNIKEIVDIQKSSDGVLLYNVIYEGDDNKVYSLKSNEIRKLDPIKATQFLENKISLMIN